MKITLLLLVALLLPVFLLGQTEKETWEEQQRKEKEQWEEQNRREKEAWEKQQQETQQRWQDMVDRESAAWQAHVAAVKKKWQQIKFSDVRTWVGYGDNKESRFEADFDNGNLQIEILGDPKDSPGVLQQKAIEILHQLLREKMRSQDEPILKDQLEIEPDSKEIPAGYVDTRNYTSPEGRQYEKLTINIPFRQDHIRIRARRVAPFVQRYAQKYDINPQLVMAVIHTESSFNPKAMSTFRRSRGQVGHAYGLMQLVPYSGGKEAYELLGGYGEPSPQLLFDPEKNIELGVVYLYKLKRHYFDSVSDLQNRRYLITAGYNTGPHNVAKAMVGRRDIKAAIPVINSMTPNRLFSHLIYNLPYRETRDYLQKVAQRMALY